MSEQSSGKPGPVMAEGVDEVRGVFPSDAALESALSELTLAGFDRADFSLPVSHPSPDQATPELGAAAPVTDTDVRQTRTMGTSMAGSAGAMAAAGATIATGGAAAIAIAAASAVGVGAALAANAAGNAGKNAKTEARNAAAQAGELVLAVHIRDPGQQGAAERIMRAAGASAVTAVTRQAASGIDSAGWTG